MAQRVKYQVFISSTYNDLREARSAVLHAVLRHEQIPAGMEGFPATHDRGWELIRRTIDDSDFYVLLVGGLYGSVEPPSAVSWTEREYDYATKAGLRVLAFIRTRKSTPGDLVESCPERMRLLDRFVERVKSNHLCKEWETPQELGALVGEALMGQLRGEGGGVGWSRQPPSPSSPTPAASQSVPLSVSPPPPPAAPWVSSIFDDRRAVSIQPLAIAGHDPMPSAKRFGEVQRRDRRALTVTMPRVPFGRQSTGPGGVEHHELRGCTPRTVVEIPWSTIEAARPDPSGRSSFTSV